MNLNTKRIYCFVNIPFFLLFDKIIITAVLRVTTNGYFIPKSATITNNYYA